MTHYSEQREKDICDSEFTPFAKWRENNVPDPHGNYYNEDSKKIAYSHLSSKTIADNLVYKRKTYPFIMWLISGKEHLRWLSRKLYRIASCHKTINQERSRLLLGNLTDDELANIFFLTENVKDLEAGKERILWLIYLIEEIENKQTGETK